MAQANSRLVSKKVKRKQALFMKQEPNSSIAFQEQPTCFVFIANGGLQNGLSRELLQCLLITKSTSECDNADLKELYLPAGKDHAFAAFKSPKAASAAVTTLNGVCVQDWCKSTSVKQQFISKLLSGPPLHLYLSFVDGIPQACVSPFETRVTALPPGLVILRDFISLDEEKQLLDFFSLSSRTIKPSDEEKACLKNDDLATTTFQAPENVLRHRQVKHYGYEFLYSCSNVDPDSPLPGGLPDVCEPLLTRMMEQMLVEVKPDQLTVNHYLPGAGT